MEKPVVKEADAIFQKLLEDADLQEQIDDFVVEKQFSTMFTTPDQQINNEPVHSYEEELEFFKPVVQQKTQKIVGPSIRSRPVSTEFLQDLSDLGSSIDQISQQKPVQKAKTQNKIPVLDPAREQKEEFDMSDLGPVVLPPDPVVEETQVLVDITRTDSQNQELLQPLNESLIPINLQLKQSLIEKPNNPFIYPNYVHEMDGQFHIRKAYASITNTDVIESYSVSQPQKEQDTYFSYSVRGLNFKTKQIQIVPRRFSHFLLLREVLVFRFAALYVPPLPKKMLYNNLSNETAKERTYLLNRFIQQLALCPYLLESQEFQLFMNREGDFVTGIKQLNLNIKKDPVYLLKQCESYFILQGTFKDQQIQDCLQQIYSFTVMIERMKKFLLKFIQVIIDTEKKFDANNKRMQDLNKLLYEYENLSVEAYSPAANKYLGKVSSNKTDASEQTALLLFENPNNLEIKKEFDQLFLELNNPFTKMRLWLMYEVLEIEALKEAFQKRRQIQKIYRTTVQKTESDLEELSRLERGQFVLGTLLMTKESTALKIQRMQEDQIKWLANVVNTRLHMQCVTVHMTKCLLPFFKRQKFEQYFENVKLFAGREILNGEKQVDLYEKIIGLNKDLISMNETHWRIRDMQSDSRIIAFDKQQGNDSDDSMNFS